MLRVHDRPASWPWQRRREPLTLAAGSPVGEPAARVGVISKEFDPGASMVGNQCELNLRKIKTDFTACLVEKYSICGFNCTNSDKFMARPYWRN
jgi:hypothetical protein